MKKLIHEIHRRSLWQVLGIYLATGWIVLQVVDVIGNSFGMPDWVPPAALILLLIGLPIVLATAFVQEGMASAAPAAPAASEPTVADDVSEASSGGAAAPREPPSRSPTTRSGRLRLFTWRNAILGGVGAFALLGLTSAGYMTMRTLGIGPAGTLVAKGVIEEAEPIVLADFDDAAGDRSLADAVTYLIRTDLTESPTVTLLEPADVGAALERMERPDTTRVTFELAREIAEREGIKAVLAGEVRTLGGATVVSTRLVTADGETLIPMRETADDTTGIIDAVNRLSKRLRERLGESLRSVQAAPALERVMTASLPALRLYTAGRRLSLAGRPREGTDLYRQAVVIDPTFAWAHYDLAVDLRNIGVDRAAQIEAVQRAFELRDRLPEAARFNVEAVYYSPPFRNEPEMALQAYASALALDSMNVEAAANLAWTHRWMRNDRLVERFARRALAIDTLDPFPHLHLVRLNQNLDRRRESDSMLALWERRLPDHAWIPPNRMWASVVWGEYEEAEAMLPDLVTLSPGTAGYAQEWLDELHGKTVLANERRRRRLAEDGDPADFAIWLGRAEAYSAAALGGPTDRAAARLDSIATRRVASLPGLSAERVWLAYGWALLGRPERARRVLEAFDDATPEGFLGEAEPVRHRAVGAIALAEGRVDDAIASFRAADVGECLVCALPDLARAYHRAGQPDSVVAVLERYVNTRFWGPSRLWAIDRPLAYERLGQLYDERGDLANAAKYYAQFVDLWTDADEALQPRVHAAQARLEEIVSARG